MGLHIKPTHMEDEDKDEDQENEKKMRETVKSAEWRVESINNMRMTHG